MPGRSFRIGRIAGIPVGVSPWWLLIVALFTWTLGASYYPEVVTGIAPVASYGLGLASVLLLFLSILAHEFGHALVARRHGIEIEEIDLWLLGGVSRMRGEAHAPGDELRYAIAGPAVTAVIGACFGAAALLLPDSTPKALLALIEYEAFVNAAILVLNLMPAFPLDGGRVLRALLWRRSGRLGPATERAAAVGRGFGYLLIVLGVIELLNGFPEGLWFALIGFFIVYRTVNSPFGEILKAIRENEPRAVSLGYRTLQYKLAAFVLSAAIAGLAGAMKAIVAQNASLTDVSFSTSGEVVLMTLVGGMGTFYGPVVGALIVVSMQNYLAQFGEWVTVIQGVVFVACVLAFRRGIVGELAARAKISL